ncbi:Srp68 [Kluyveromyces lactis]|nr:Srp68 [Kluyveromyces lactis]
MVYSPLGVTYGFRSNLLLESFADYHKYHKKVNHKLQQLRGRLKLISKDSKNYKGQEKLDKITHEDYSKNRLYGFLMLLLAERDVAYVESIKATGRSRGHLRSLELKLMRTRIKKAIRYCDRLISLAQAEDKWQIQAEIMIYEKLIRTEYELYGKKQVKFSDAEKISTHLALALAAVNFLVDSKLLKEGVAEAVKSKYLYIFKEKANAFSVRDQQSYISRVIQANPEDQLLQLLQSHGFSFSVPETDASKSQSREISWRSYSATIEDSKVFEVYSELAELHNSSKLSNLNDKLFKWNRAIDLQKEYMTTCSEDDTDENNQILLTYLQYNAMVTGVERDSSLFESLLKQWERFDNKSFTSKLNKYKEVDHIIKNLKSLLSQIMDLPGVYSDSDLTNQVFLLKTYYETCFTSKLLANIYQSKKKYVESLALYVDCLQRIENAEESLINWDEIYLPSQLLSKGKITDLKKYITTGWRSVIALAEHKKSMEKNKKTRQFEPSLVEILESKVRPSDVSLDNLYPLAPRLLPIPPKPFLYDLAYNYFNIPDSTSVTEDSVSSTTAEASQDDEPVKKSKAPSKKGLFGLFRG